MERGMEYETSNRTVSNTPFETLLEKRNFSQSDDFECLHRCNSVIQKVSKNPTRTGSGTQTFAHFERHIQFRWSDRLKSF